MRQTTIALSCDAGYECQPGTDTAWWTTRKAAFECPKGLYCETKSGTPNGVAVTACPGGTYRDLTGGSALSSCTNCPSGSYCPQGASKPILCPPGHFCGAGVGLPVQVSAGYYSPVYGLAADAPGGTGTVACPAKFYCLAGTVIPLKCPGGKFCTSGLSTDGTNCPAGKFSGAQSIELTTECRDCWKGHYCPEGSQFPT